MTSTLQDPNGYTLAFQPDTEGENEAAELLNGYWERFGELFRQHPGLRNQHFDTYRELSEELAATVDGSPDEQKRLSRILDLLHQTLAAQAPAPSFFEVGYGGRSGGQKQISVRIQDTDSEPPQELLDLKLEGEHSAQVIESINWRGQADAKNRAKERLLEILRIGLEYHNPRPRLARESLEALQKHVVDTRGGRIRELFWLKLGFAVLISCAFFVAVILLTLSEGQLSVPWFGVALPSLWQDTIQHVAAIGLGSSIGLWLVFGMRRQGLQFHELSRIKTDFLAAASKVLFVNTVAIALGLLVIPLDLSLSIAGGAASVRIGEVLAHSVVFGLICGLAEWLVPAHLSEPEPATERVRA